MTLVVTDNRGYGCINRLQVATGGAPFNNLLADAHHEILPEIDFAAHAASLVPDHRKSHRLMSWKRRFWRPLAVRGSMSLS